MVKHGKISDEKGNVLKKITIPSTPSKIPFKS